MKKVNQLMLWIVAIGFVCQSCMVDDAQPLGKYENGVLIINEGNYGAGSGSVSFWNTTLDIVSNDIYNAENGLGISATIQNAHVYQDRIYLITNLPDKIEVVNAQTFKRITTVTDKLSNPFDFVAIGNRGFFTNWGDYDISYNNPKGALKVLDLTTNTVLNDSIAFGNRVMGLLTYNNKLYVANEIGNKVAVVNPNTLAIEVNINVDSPSKMVLDANNKIWVISSAGKLVRINPANNMIEQTINNVDVSGYNEKISINKEKNKIYYLSSSFSGNSEVYGIDISATSAPANPLIVGENLYGLGISPTDNLIYVGDSNAFQGNGKVMRFEANGTPIDTINAGIGPNNFLFR